MTDTDNGNVTSLRTSQHHHCSNRQPPSQVWLRLNNQVLVTSPIVNQASIERGNVPKSANNWASDESCPGLEYFSVKPFVSYKVKKIDLILTSTFNCIQSSFQHKIGPQCLKCLKSVHLVQYGTMKMGAKQWQAMGSNSSQSVSHKLKL